MQEVFKTLNSMLKDEGKDAELSEAIIFAAWRRVIGENLREQAVPFRVNKKNLIVAVASETWKHHLENLSGQMLFKLNGALGKVYVTFIEFRIDEATVDAERERLYRENMSQFERDRLAMKTVPPNIRESVKNIADDNLRRAFLRAAGSSLARRQRLKNVNR